MDTRVIQRRLAQLGFDPGPIDGIRGRRTSRAIRDFQANRGLTIDGLVGAATIAALFPTAETTATSHDADLPWLDEARRLTGTREVPGRGNCRTIIDWAEDLDLAYSGDDIPWCGLFVGHCIASTLPDEPLPANVLGARNWRRFGQNCDPTKGCVLVFWRTHATRSVNGHVGFYVGEDATSFHVLGGNQSDRVGVARISKTRLLAARYPAGIPLGPPQVVPLAAASTPVSGSEA